MSDGWSPSVNRSTPPRLHPSTGCSREFDRLDDPLDQALDAVHVTGSAIVVGPRGVVLLRHKRLGLWLQPGGHIDPGETPWDAALREAQEETGLEVSFGDVDDAGHARVWRTSTCTTAGAGTPTSTCATWSTAATPTRPRPRARARRSPGSTGPQPSTEPPTTA